MKDYRIITLTHKKSNLRFLSRFVIPTDQNRDNTLVGNKLSDVKSFFGIRELMYLATCNRVSYIYVSNEDANPKFVEKFYQYLYPYLNASEIEQGIELTSFYNGKDAVSHLFELASSMDSLVIGEREIYKQLKGAYLNCREMGLTGDELRIVQKMAMTTAKDVYNRTQITRRPISVVSLAVKHLLKKELPEDTKFLIIGAGQTNNLMAKFLKKQPFKNYTVFNRTYDHAKDLANKLGGDAYPLSDLAYFNKDFDVLITCTGATDPIIDEQIWKKIVSATSGRKIVVDLGVPHNVSQSVVENNELDYISIDALKEIAAENMEFRQKELVKAKKVIKVGVEEFHTRFQERRVEKAMTGLPTQIKEIRDKAVNNVFSKDVESMDEKSRETLDKVLDYLEKKYVSIPIKTARSTLQEFIK